MILLKNILLLLLGFFLTFHGVSRIRTLNEVKESSHIPEFAKTEAPAASVISAPEPKEIKPSTPETTTIAARPKIIYRYKDYKIDSESVFHAYLRSPNRRKKLSIGVRPDTTNH